MQTPAAPYHQQQILAGIPSWARQLHPHHATRLMRQAHNEHIQEDGQPTAWFQAASQPLQSRLRGAIEQRRVSRQRLQQALADLQTLPQFCDPLLQQALPISVAVATAQYCHQPFELIQTGTFENVPGLEAFGAGGGSFVPEWTSEAVGSPVMRSLLEAAMHNFEGVQEVGPFSTLQASATHAVALPGLSVSQFVTHCRRLDLGARYQRHLDTVFSGERKAQVQTAWINAHRAELTVQAVIALIRGQVTELGYQALRYFCTDGIPPKYGNYPVTVRSLHVLGMQVNGALLLGPADEAEVIAYLPFDEQQPLREFSSVQHMQQYLGRSLQDPSYRQRFLEHIGQHDRPKMARELTQALYEDVGGPYVPPGLAPLEPTWPDTGEPATTMRPVSSPDLGIREPLRVAPYWEHLYEEHVRRFKDNARAIAVPTAEVDAKARQERLEHWEELGLNVLNVAAMFVPGLDVVMLGVFAVQLMGNIFHAYEAWREGDNAEAVAQVESLLLTLGSAVVIGAAAKGVKASGFVDWLENITVGDEPRLWEPQLQPYRSSVQLPDELKPDNQGLFALQDRHFVRLDGDTYEVRQSPQGHWELHHPQDPQAYRPRLHGNGKGAWRLAHERVTSWDRVKLLRRLGPAYDRLSNADLVTALDITGLDRAVIEPVLADGGQLPALLEDILLRLDKDLEADDIIARTRNGQPLAAYRNFAVTALCELPSWPEDVLVQVFEGTEPMGAFTRYGRDQPGDMKLALTRTDLDNGDLARIVLQQLEESRIAALLPEGTQPAQRQQALQNLLADHLLNKRQSLFDSLYSGQRASARPAAQALGAQFISLPSNALEEIIDATSSAEHSRLLDGRVPLRVAEEARALQARGRLDRALLGLYRTNLANADSALIRENLLAEHPEWSDEQLCQAALAERANAARLIGQQPARPRFQSPLRLSDGRLGYPLSPGIFSTKAERDLHALFPGLSDPERRALMATLRRRGDVASQIEAYRAEWTTLNEQLNEWAQRHAEERQADANRARRVFRRAWRRLDADALKLADLQLDSLPPLITRFDHIKKISLRNVTFPAIPADYLQSFPALEELQVQGSPTLDMPSLFAALRHAPNLVELSVESSGLERLPVEAHGALPTLAQLRFIALRRNGLALTAEDVELLTGLRQLRALDLYRNRIVLNGEMAARFSALRQLRILNLGSNPLAVSPALGGLISLANLNLASCELHGWPTGLEVLMSSNTYALRQVDLSSNHLTRVPRDELVTAPFVQALRFRLNNEQWRFNYNPLTEPTRQWLQSAGASVEIHIADETVEPSPRPSGWLVPESTSQQATWDELFVNGANSELRDALMLAGMSSAARSNPARLSRQIWSLLNDAAADSALRTRLNDVAELFPVSCGDAGADVFSSLQIEAKVFELTSGQNTATTELFRYFQSLYRRDQVNELAQDIFNARRHRRDGLLLQRQWELQANGARPSVGDLHSFDGIHDDTLLEGRGLDLIEIRMALRTTLANELQFSEPQTEMLYRQQAEVADTTLRAVLQEVRRRDLDVAARREWVSHQPNWRRVLRAEHLVRFEGLRERWDAGVDYLEACLGGSEVQGSLEQPVADRLSSVLDQSPLDSQGQPVHLAINDGQYEAGMRSMAQGLENDEDALYLELTRPLDVVA